MSANRKRKQESTQNAPNEPESKKVQEEKHENNDNESAHHANEHSRAHHFSLSKILEGLKVNDVTGFMKDGTAITVKKGDSLFAAFMTLIDNKILSAVIEDEKGQYSGFVDTLDIMTATIDIAEKHGTFSKPVDPDDELIEETFEMDELNVKAIADLSGRDSFVSVKNTDGVMEVVKLLSEKNRHRLAVISDNDPNDNNNNGNTKYVGLITQSGLCEYLLEEHAEKFSHYNTKISQMELPHEVCSVGLEEKAFEAFKTMRDKRVSGLAVVDKNGILVDVISSSDLMIWTEWNANGEKFRFRDLAALSLPLSEFLTNSRAQRDVSHDKPLVCTNHTLIRDALTSMLENNVHRLFRVNEANIPTALVTYGDILRHFIKHNP